MAGTFIFDDNGVQRHLGNNEPPAGLTKAWPVFGDLPDEPIIPRSEWDKYLTPDFSDPFAPPIRDQDGVGQCNCDATMALLQYRRMQQGLPYVEVSAGDLYDRINGGGDNGSLLEDALHEMVTNGVGTIATCGTNIWHRGWKGAPAAERAKYKGLEVCLYPTFDHLVSGVIKGFGCVSGLWWYGGYAPGSDGWLQLRTNGGRGGHAVFGYALAKRGNEYGVRHRNSWTPTWGVSGCAVFGEAMYHQGGIGGWWGMRSAVDEGGVIPGA